MTRISFNMTSSKTDGYKPVINKNKLSVSSLISKTRAKVL